MRPLSPPPRICPRKARPRALPFVALASLAAFALHAAAAHGDDHGAAVVLSPAAPPSPVLLAPTLEAPPDLSPFLGKPVTVVDVASDGAAWGANELPVVRSVKPGELFTPALVRRAIAEVLETGRFAHARASASADGAGVRVVLIVTSRKLIESLKMDLHGVRIEREEFLHDADLAEGGEILGSEIGDKQARLEAVLARHGYPHGAVDLEIRPTPDPIRVTLLLDVKPGNPLTIDKRVFYPTDVDAKAIEDETKTYAVKPGDRADEPSLDAADLALEALLRASGYHRADVRHDVVRYRGGVFLRLRIDAGKRFEARFEGNESYDKDALGAALGIDKRLLPLTGGDLEQDLGPAHLADKLAFFYRARGFLDVEVTAEERGSNVEPLHYLVFHVVEHSRVRVVARTYPCLRERDVARLTEGGPTSAAKLGVQIDSFLEDELPGADLLKGPHPDGLDALIAQAASGGTEGARPAPIDLNPDATFVPDTYDRAAAHVQELYRNEGFLHAQIGPVQVLRQTCDPKSRAGSCKPLPSPALPAERCAYDAANLPLPVAPLDKSFTCTPDAARGVDCASALTLRIPSKLGPRTFLYDVQFTGTKSIPPVALLDASGLVLGSPANLVKLEDARRLIVERYHQDGYAFADVKYALEESLDHTRARALFTVSEGEKVIVRDILVVGNEITKESIIRKRITLAVGQPFKSGDAARTQELIATLGVFTSVSVALQDPYVPAKNKTVIVSVTETLPEAVEVRPGFSTGEGFRLTSEYSNKNIGGTAIGFTGRVVVSYLPDVLILDDGVRAHYQQLSAYERIAGRITLRGDFPDIGLGPLVRFGIDGVGARTLQRDFALTKFAGIPTLTYRPTKGVQLAFGPSAEYNFLNVFGEGGFAAVIPKLQASNPELARQLREPDGESSAYSERFIITHDRRDSALNAHTGTYLSSGLEHTDWYPVNRPASDPLTGGHTLRFSQTFAGYIPIAKRVTFAAELRAGTIIQLTENSKTYPDRFFFLGGIDSMRGWLQDTFIPQDFVDQIEATKNKADGDPTKVNPGTILIRGGNLMVNPKFELRFPFIGPLDGALFVDTGNLWANASYPFQHGLSLRTSVGAGIRLVTPFGPLVFDYGINVSNLTIQNGALYKKRGYEDFGALGFTIGAF